MLKGIAYGLFFGLLVTLIWMAGGALIGIGTALVMTEPLALPFRWLLAAALLLIFGYEVVKFGAHIFWGFSKAIWLGVQAGVPLEFALEHFWLLEGALLPDPAESLRQHYTILEAYDEGLKHGTKIGNWTRINETDHANVLLENYNLKCRLAKLEGREPPERPDFTYFEPYAERFP